MKTTLLLDQPAILRLLVEQGVDSKIRPQVEGYPSATGLVPDTTDRRKWYVITTDMGKYSAAILEDCDEAEAMEFTIDHVKSIAEKIGAVSIIDTPAPTPKRN